MMSGMYAAISGLDAHQTMLDVTANNLANVDTIGYKAQSVQFSDELSQLVQAGTGANGSPAGAIGSPGETIYHAGGYEPFAARQGDGVVPRFLERELGPSEAENTTVTSGGRLRHARRAR